MVVSPTTNEQRSNDLRNLCRATNNAHHRFASGYASDDLEISKICEGRKRLFGELCVYCLPAPVVATCNSR